MLTRLKFTQVGPVESMAIDFAPRLNVITGDNGLGKSFILDCAWWALTQSWYRDTQALPRRNGKLPASEIEYEVMSKTKRAAAHQSRFSLEDWSWSRPQGRPPSPGLVVYARADGGFSVWDPARNYWRQLKSATLDQKDRPSAFHFRNEDVWNGLEDEVGGQRRILCNGLLRDWVSWQRGKTEEFAHLSKVLEALSPSEGERLIPGEPVRVSPNDARDIPTIKMPYGSVPVIHASAGARRIVGLAYLIVWAWHEHRRAVPLLHQKPTDRIVFIVDEIEAHLHPRWQRAIVPALLGVIASLQPKAKVQVLACTHAPLVLASIEPHFDTAMDKLFDLDLVDGSIAIRLVDWRPHGDASAWLTSEIFNLGEARSLEAQQAIAQARKAFETPDLPLAKVKAIHEKLQSFLKETDPFWPRWLYRAEKAGLKL